MIAGKVIGSVVSTVKHPILKGHKILLVKPIKPDGTAYGKVIVALDTVQAGEGDTVLVMDEGNSGRLILGDKTAPVRTVIVGIVDKIENTINVNRKRK